MARKPTIKSSTTSNQLLQALEFCSVVSEKTGAPHETHISLRNNWAIAFNGVIAAGHPIVEDCSIHAHTLLLAEALSKCGEGYSITQLDQNRLVLKYNKFKAIVPCLDQSLMQSAEPDPPIASINNNFLESIKTVNIFEEDDSHVVTASILIKDGSILATNRKVIYEEWHGNSMPTLAIPKSFVKILKKVKKSLISFGYSNNSFTLWFENNSWLKTQLHAYKWPDLDKILNLKCNDWPVPPNLWEALATIKNFSQDGWIYSKDGILYSHPDKETGASFECSGIPTGVNLSIDQLEFIKPWAERIDFSAPSPNGKCIKVFGNKSRCVIAYRN